MNWKRGGAVAAVLWLVMAAYLTNLAPALEVIWHGGLTAEQSAAWQKARDKSEADGCFAPDPKPLVYDQATCLNDESNMPPIPPTDASEVAATLIKSFGIMGFGGIIAAAAVVFPVIWFARRFRNPAA